MKKKAVPMPLKKAITEHVRLSRVLKHPSKQSLAKEYKIQHQELLKFKKSK